MRELSKNELGFLAGSFLGYLAMAASGRGSRHVLTDALIGSIVGGTLGALKPQYGTPVVGMTAVYFSLSADQRCEGVRED